MTVDVESQYEDTSDAESFITADQDDVEPYSYTTLIVLIGVPLCSNLLGRWCKSEYLVIDTSSDT